MKNKSPTHKCSVSVFYQKMLTKCKILMKHFYIHIFHWLTEAQRLQSIQIWTIVPASNWGLCLVAWNSVLSFPWCQWWYQYLLYLLPVCPAQQLCRKPPWEAGVFPKETTIAVWEREEFLHVLESQPKTVRHRSTAAYLVMWRNSPAHPGIFKWEKKKKKDILQLKESENSCKLTIRSGVE